jgi:3-isopropylmalate dehydrogenase
MSKIYKIIELIGDGISKEITHEALKLLNVIQKTNPSIKFQIKQLPIGYTCYKQYKTPITKEIINQCKNSDGVLLGAVGHPEANKLQSDLRPEKGLLRLREGMGLYSNIRPVVVYNNLIDASPVKSDIIQGTDIVFVRELSAGIYKSECGILQADYAEDIMKYSSQEINRILRYSFKLASQRKKKLCIVDKSNVLNTSKLWRTCSYLIKQDFPDVEVEYQYVDAMSYFLVKQPTKYDVIVTANLFGDILSDEAAILSSSLGMLPSMSLNDYNCGLYEPVHGSAPDIEGQGIANPTGTILSLAMMLRQLGQTDYAKFIEQSISNVLSRNCFTKDINPSTTQKSLTTSEFGDEVVNEFIKLI